MKKVLIGGVAALVVTLVAGGLFVSSRPDTLSAEATVVVDATVADLEPLARDLRGTYLWSPWKDLDPELVQEWSTPTTGVGAWYTWDGNDEVGRGKQSTVEDGPNHVMHELQFFEPMEGVAHSTLRWVSEGDGLKITWTFEQPADFPTKLANLALDIEGMLTGDFTKGMRQLKPLVEARAQERLAAAAVEAAAVEVVPPPAE